MWGAAATEGLHINRTWPEHFKPQWGTSFGILVVTPEWDLRGGFTQSSDFTGWHRSHDFPTKDSATSSIPGHCSHSVTEISCCNIPTVCSPTVTSQQMCWHYPTEVETSAGVAYGWCVWDLFIVGFNTRVTRLTMAHLSDASFSRLLHHRIQSKSTRTAFQSSICPGSTARNGSHLPVPLLHGTIFKGRDLKYVLHAN